MEIFTAKNNKQTQSFLFAIIAIAMGTLIGLLVGRIDNILLLLGIPVGIFVVILTISKPELGLHIFIFITYIRLSDILVHNYHAPSIAKPIIAILILSIVLRWAITKQLPESWLRVTALVLAYGVVVFGSIFIATDFTKAQLAASNYWKDGLIAILLVLLIQNKQTFKQVIWILIIAGLFMGSISVHQYFTGNFSSNYLGFASAPLLNIVSGTEGYRVSGTIGDPNYYAQIMLVLMPLAINRVLFEQKKSLKLLAGISVLIIGMTIIFTFSRGGFVALLVALMAMILYNPPKLKYSLLIIGVTVIILLSLPSNFTARMGTITGLATGEDNPATEVSFRGRVSELLSAWHMFRDNPFLGVGVQNYPVYYQQYARQIGLDPRAENRQPHNLYLEVAAETGLIGLLVFGSVLVTVFYSIKFTRSKFIKNGDSEYTGLVEAFSSGIIGYLAAAMFIHGAYPRYFWLLVGIALALPQLGKDKNNPYGL